jgi:hypothetical protein
MATTTDDPPTLTDDDARNGTDPADAQSLEEMEANGTTPDGDEDERGEDPPELFELYEHGKRVTLATLYARNTPVEFEFILGGKGIKGAAGMGLVAFTDPDLTLVVPGRAGKVEVDPTYDADGNIKKVRIAQHFKPRMAYDARTEAGQVAVTGEA